MAAPVSTSRSSRTKRRGERWKLAKTHAARGGAYKRLDKQLGVHPEALRTWVKQVETVQGLRHGRTTDDATRIAERASRELRGANTILTQASACLSRRSSTAHLDE